MSLDPGPAAHATALLRDGIGHHQRGDLGAAERSYREVLRLVPGHSQALHFLGIMAGQLGRNDDAADLLRQALTHDRRNARLWRDLGQAHRHRGDFPAALEAYRKSIKLRPDFLEAYADCAAAAREEAERAARAGAGDGARELRRLAAHYLNGLGRALWELGRRGDAEVPLRDAAALDPANADALNNLGSVLRATGRAIEAEQAYRHALAVAPGLAEAWNNLGNALIDQGRSEAAAGAYRQALALRPGLKAAEENLRRWGLYNLCFRGDLSAEAVAEAHRDWGRVFVKGIGAAPAGSFANRREPGRALRVGYVSPDLRRHSVAYFLEPLLARHDPDRVESFCYAEVAAPDAVTARLKALAWHWRSSVGQSDAELARQIRDDGIDILIDLAGHTANSRLTAFAPKPAPVAIAWLGYPATSGLPTVDWRLTDAIADPPGAADHLHSERLHRLPRGFLCYRPPEEAPAVAPPPSLASGRATFGSFNNLAKVTPEVAALWARLLLALPQSRLLLKDRNLADEGTQRKYLDLFAAEGVAPERLVLRSWVADTAAHLALYGEVDVALDPFPYNGTTTSCEALWMGVPVVTLAGDRHSARVGASLLTHAGLAEWVAATPDAYVSTALALACDGAALAAWRRALRPRLAASALRDETGFTRDFEAALRALWRQWCEAGPAAG